MRQKREAEQEARWARQRGLLPADPAAPSGYDSDGSSNSGNCSGNGNGGEKPSGSRSRGGGAFYQRLYFSAAPTAPSMQSGGGGGELRHPLLDKDHLSAVQEGQGEDGDGEEEEEREWGEAKDAMDASMASSRV